jgi:hypothetical protein
MIPGTVHRSPGICLMAEETPENLNWIPSDDGAMQPVIVSNGVHFLQMKDLLSMEPWAAAKKNC